MKKAFKKILQAFLGIATELAMVIFIAASALGICWLLIKVSQGI